MSRGSPVISLTAAIGPRGWYIGPDSMQRRKDNRLDPRAFFRWNALLFFSDYPKPKPIHEG
jgi:hypothetical protein